MCGKFTARASWTEIVDYALGLSGADEPDDDRVLAYRVMSEVAVIVRDADERRTMKMRWGFPDPSDWRRPRPIHARGETIDRTPAFAQAFRDGQRGIVLVQSFNEAPDDGRQHVVTPAGAIGIAFLWRRFDIPAGSLLACVMVTVAANTLLAGLPTDRMPAVLAPEDWATWLGEGGASPDQAKACLRTMEDARWTMRPEERAARPGRGKPTVSDPGGLF